MIEVILAVGLILAGLMAFGCAVRVSEERAVSAFLRGKIARADDELTRMAKEARDLAGRVRELKEQLELIHRVSQPAEASR